MKTEVTLEEGCALYDGDDIIASATESGWEATEIPTSGKEPILPSNLSDLGLNELRNLQQVFGAWYDYLTNQIISLRLGLTSLEETLKFIRAHILRTATGTKEERESAILLNQDYMRANAKYIKWTTLCDVHKDRLKRMSKDLEIISRQMSALLEPYGTKESRFQ